MFVNAIAAAFALAQASPSDDTMELRCAAAMSWYFNVLQRQGNRALPELAQSYGVMHFFLGRLNARNSRTDWSVEANRLAAKFGPNDASMKMVNLCVSLESDLLHAKIR